jgi:DNA-directed RNA polymerase I, II, and III subunit RPABC5
MFPIRCFTCGKIIGNMWEKYKDTLESGKEPSDAFKKLGVRRYCCKRMFLGHVDITEKLLLYCNKEPKKKESEEKKYDQEDSQE